MKLGEKSFFFFCAITKSARYRCDSDSARFPSISVRGETPPSDPIRFFLHREEAALHLHSKLPAINLPDACILFAPRKHIRRDKRQKWQSTFEVSQFAISPEMNFYLYVASLLSRCDSEQVRESFINFHRESVCSRFSRNLSERKNI